MYMITYTDELVNKNFEIYIEVPVELKDLLKEARFACYHHYQIKYISNHEVICPRFEFPDGTWVIILPYWLIPGRPYPLQVYLYANALYSLNPDKGQRWAANETRKKFKLETFSHSTISRSFRLIEQMHKQLLERKYGMELTASGANEPLPERQAENPVAGENTFLSVSDTANRRIVVAAFLSVIIKAIKMRENIEDACVRYAKEWYGNKEFLILNKNIVPATEMGIKNA
jgi:hypothetical protein